MTTPITKTDVIDAANLFAAKLDAIQVATMKRNYPNLPDNCINRVTVKRVGTKFIYIDFGGSGAYLVEKTTGEIYNIASAYGVPDKNKKVKADLGNIFTADPQFVYERRWNYLTKSGKRTI